MFSKAVLLFPLQDPRFNRDVDVKTGFRTHSLVCMPVCNYDGEVIGVAQIINKRGSDENHEFTETDIKVFERYLTFCGIGIQNAQLFEVSILEYKKNQVRTRRRALLLAFSNILCTFRSCCYLWLEVFFKNKSVWNVWSPPSSKKPRTCSSAKDVRFTC